MSIEEKVLNIVSIDLGRQVTTEDSFKDLHVDSLTLIEIIVDCEKNFDVAINDKRIKKLKTIGDLVKLVRELDMRNYFESTQADLQTND